MGYLLKSGTLWKFTRKERLVSDNGEVNEEVVGQKFPFSTNYGSLLPYEGILKKSPSIEKIRTLEFKV